MQRSISLDVLKIFLNFFVIAAHLYPLFGQDSMLGWFIINGFSRVVVPSFLIINGYFLASKIENTSAIKKYLTHLLIVYITWSLFYSQSYIAWESIRNIATFWITGYHHLWYLPALLVGVIMLYCFKRWSINDKYLLVLAFLLYIVGNQINFANLPAPLSRNGLFYGYTFITLGYLMKKYSIHTYVKETWHLIALLISAIFLVIFETDIYYNADLEMNLFISSLILGPTSILLCLRHPMFVNKSIVTEYLGYMPTGIYYVHLFYVYKFYSVDYNIYNVPIIFLLSALTVIPLVFINKRVKIFL